MNGKVVLGLLGLGFIVCYWYTLFWFATTYIIHAPLTIGGVFLGLLGVIGFIMGVYITFVVLVIFLAVIISD